jgi:hypothetical protein
VLDGTLAWSRRPQMKFLFVAWQVLVRRKVDDDLRPALNRLSHGRDGCVFGGCQLNELPSQASSPRSVTLPQLPSPRTNFL